jgi:polyisoprenoid-binding protein YceI
MKWIIGLGVVVVVIVVGLVAYSFLQTPEEASGPIEAIPVAAEPASMEASEKASGSEDPGQAAPASGEETSASAANASSATFEIVPAESEVRFVIEEVLNGAPKTVVGTTDQIAGEMAINADDPAGSVIGPVLINARTLTTDNDFRNRAIKNRILSTNEFEFITFAPTGLEGMPESVSVGESFSFQIIGDLTVREVTKELTFDATVTPISETQLEGTASAVILYADFGLVIPDVPSVASVEDDVRLEIDFIATAQ